MLRKLIFSLFTLFIIIFFFNCDKKDDNPVDPEPIKYATSDLQGTWEGDATLTGSSNDGTYVFSITFDSDGNMLNWSPSGPGFTILSGVILVTVDGEITGSVRTEHTETSGHTETTIMDWDGSTFTSKSKMNITITCSWSSTNGSSGTYGLTV